MITTIKADLSTQMGRENVIKRMFSLRKIVGLVHNAASNKPISLLQNLPLKEWHKQVAINLDAPLFLTKDLLHLMKSGRIINLTTGTTNFVVSGSASYAMTKAAINIFTKYLSEELRSKKILVTAAHPGIVKTDLIENIMKHNDSTLGIYKAQKKFQEENKYLNVNLSAKFLCWLLLGADDSLYTGDIIGIYNKKYQPLWHDEIIPSPYPDNLAPP